MRKRRHLSAEAKARALAQRKSIGARIREARDGKELSQSELAALVGLEAGSISKQERGVFSPCADTVVKLADALDVRERWLITGEGPMEREAAA